MAIIYQLDEGATVVPSSERQLLHAFAPLPDEWVVLHSVRWQGVRGRRQSDGEADFVILHRQYGILVLEIKGGGIGIEAGQWRSVDRYGSVHKIKNPYTQATQSKHALLNFLANSDPQLAQIIVGHAVVFPDVQTEENLGPAASPAITLFAGDLIEIESRLKSVFEHWGATRVFSSEQLKRIVQLLAPTVEVTRRLKVDVEKTELELLRLTASQQRAFAQLRSIPRLAILGGPGTGKTLLAVERARSLARQGGRVLFLCFNELLSRQIARELEDAPEVEVSTFHRFGISRLRPVGVPVPVRPDARWWEDEAASQLHEVLSGSSDKFDAVIIDEAQDFAPSWFLAVQAALLEGIRGQMYVFADDRQELWNRDWRAGIPDFAEYVLSDNCRNSGPIAACVNAIYGDAPPPLAASGVPVLAVEYQPSDDIVAMALELGDHLLSREGLSPSELTILVDDQRLADRLRSTYVGEVPIVSFGGRGVVCETVARFKGLESPAVLLILTGSSPSADGNRATAYVGISRARSVVVALVRSLHPAKEAITGGAGRR